MHTEVEKMSLIGRDDATEADTRVQSYTVAVTRKNFRKVKNGVFSLSL